MPHLKHWPSREEVADAVTAEWIENKLSEQGDYHKTRTMSYLDLGNDFDPVVVSAYLDFYKALKKARPGATMVSNQFTISEPVSREDRIDRILRDEATNRYYHPLDYDEYSEDDWEYTDKELREQAEAAGFKV